MPTVPDLTWRPCDHERAVNGECPDCGARVGRVSFWPMGGDCPRAPHRGPEGPNEDIAQCPACGSPDHALRPPGETFGEHLPDCSLPERHESYCVGGGQGHKAADTVRGYWPTPEREDHT